MEEISLKEIFKFLKDNVIYFILITIVVFAVGIPYSLYFKVPMYESTSTIVLATENGLTSSSELTFNQNLVDTYKEVIKSRTVIENTIDELNLSGTYEILNSLIEVTSVSGTEVIKISVKHTDADLAKLIVTTLTEIFTEEITELYKIENVKILDAASTATNAYNINIVKDVLIYFAAAILISALFLALKFSFNNTIKTVEQIESLTGLPILGAVPILSVKGGMYE
ncbi:MAG: Wzz/FepE/Etk N-terminal domain-containing protein [bacterium]